MGTVNFYTDNTNNIYEIEVGEFFEVSEFRLNLLETFKQNPKISKLFEDCEVYEEEKCYDESHPTHELFSIRKDMNNHFFEFTIWFIVKLNGGYYENACLDYKIVWDLACDTFNDTDKFFSIKNDKKRTKEYMVSEAYEIMEYTLKDHEIGLFKMVAGKVLPKIDQVTVEMAQELDAWFAEISK